MISNLVANALQYSPANAEVLVRLSRAEGEFVLEVQNPGPPIEPAALATIFEPFTRAQGTQPQGAHLGLGLYIVREVVRAHGGTIAVRSSADAGTCFTVRLPG